jgi:hypothetical protein
MFGVVSVVCGILDSGGICENGSDEEFIQNLILCKTWTVERLTADRFVGDGTYMLGVRSL